MNSVTGGKPSYTRLVQAAECQSSIAGRWYSFFVSSENSSLPLFIACASALAGIPSGFSNALTNVLVSKTKSMMSYLGIKPSKRLRSRCESVLIVSASTPISAKSIARSSLSVPDGNRRPLRRAFKALSVNFLFAAGGRLFHMEALGSSISMII